MPTLLREFRQSTRQHFFYRMVQSGEHAFWAMLGALGAKLLGAPEPVVSVSLIVSTMPLLAFLWLWVFNSGRSAVPNFVVRLTGEGIEVDRFEDVKFLSWDRFRAVRTGWFPFRRVRLKATRGRGLAFDYHALDQRQREELLRELQEGTFRHIAAAGVRRAEQRQVRGARRVHSA